MLSSSLRSMSVPFYYKRLCRRRPLRRRRKTSWMQSLSLLAALRVSLGTDCRLRRKTLRHSWTCRRRSGRRRGTWRARRSARFRRRQAQRCRRSGRWTSTLELRYLLGLQQRETCANDWLLKTNTTNLTANRLAVCTHGERRDPTATDSTNKATDAKLQIIAVFAQNQSLKLCVDLVVSSSKSDVSWMLVRTAIGCNECKSEWQHFVEPAVSTAQQKTKRQKANAAYRNWPELLTWTAERQAEPCPYGWSPFANSWWSYRKCRRARSRSWRLKWSQCSQGSLFWMKTLRRINYINWL